MNRKLTKILAFLFAGLFILSMTQVYLVVNREGITTIVRFYNISISLITIVTGIFYLFSFKSKNVKFNKIMSLLLSGCYFLSFHSIYTNYCDDNYLIAFLWTKEIILTFITFATYFLFLVLGKNKNGFKTLEVTKVALQILTVFTFINIHLDKIGTFKLGLYFYFASFIPLFLNSYLIKIDNPQEEEAEKMIKDPLDVKDSVIYANYVDGLPNDYEIKNNLAVLVNKEDTQELIIGIYSKDMDPLRLEYYKIKKIEIRREPLLMEIPKIKKDREIEKLSILGVVLKYLGSEAASDRLRNQLDEYDAIKSDIVDHIVITYVTKSEERFVHLYTKNENQTFLNTLEKASPFPIEKI